MNSLDLPTKDERGTIVLAGGAGYLGRKLADYFSSRSYRIVVLSRRPSAGQTSVEHQAWDGRTLGAWQSELEGAAALINLAGRSVNCRYHDRNRQEILNSRVDSTHVLGQALAGCRHPPPVWINSSSATIYRHALDRPMDEEGGEIGTGFSVEVCRQWEKALYAARLPNTRRVALRLAMVFGRGKDGVVEAFHRLVRVGLGGTMGAGTQFVSWIHEEDFTRAIQWVIEHPDLEGPVNCAAPCPLPNAEFLKIFRAVCRQPVGLPATAWMLEVGALILRTETELLLKSRRVVPTKLTSSGFEFVYPEMRRALEDLVR